MADDDLRDRFSAAKDQYLLAVAQDKRIGEAPAKIAIALTIAFANRREFEETGQLAAWPSMRTLADRTGLFRSRIERAIGSLEEADLLAVERPEKRGATHHNRYLLRLPIGRMGAGNSNGRTGADNRERIGRTTVSNSNGRMGADIPPPAIGRMGADAMAAPVGPNSLDETLEGVGAPSGAPRTPIQADVSSGDQSKEARDDDPGDLGAHERPPSPDPASAFFFVDPEKSPPATNDLVGEGEGDDLDIEGARMIFNTVAFAALPLLPPSLAKIITSPEDLLEICKTFDVQKRDKPQIGAAIAQGLAGLTSRATRDAVLAFIRREILKSDWESQAYLDAVFRELANAIDAATPPPVRDRSHRREMREAAIG